MGKVQDPVDTISPGYMDAVLNKTPALNPQRRIWRKHADEAIASSPSPPLMASSYCVVHGLLVELLEARLKQTDGITPAHLAPLDIGIFPSIASEEDLPEFR